MNPKSLLGVVAVVIALSCRSVSAYDGACKIADDPEVSVTTFYEEPSIDHTKTSLEIQSRRKGVSEQNRDEHPAGLTDFKQQISGDRQLLVLMPSGEAVCAHVMRLRLRMDIYPKTIFIAKEIPEPSCAYDAILGHEMKHVQVAKIFLRNHPATVERISRLFLGELGVVYGKTRGEVEEKTDNAINDYIARLNASLGVVFDRMEKGVDTPDEYQRLGDVCNGEMSYWLKKGGRGQ